MREGTAFDRKCIAVFCGSASGDHYDYKSAAFSVGEILAEAGHKVVYGGGHVGLMGAVADGCLNAGGQITGVMPHALVEREIAHQGLSDLVVVENMHERKAEMARRADAFLVLPGGSGTLEEFFEQWTWGQIGYHQKPIGLINLNGYFDALLAMINQMVLSGFLSETHRRMLVHRKDVGEILDVFAHYKPPSIKGYVHD
ncbi:MAG: TIGR00730 family Rossman fold protein [Mangrovicoccus sp.]|nr:TIGR00730 family Rossman fold protein [Mangrovicoccus sp.]